MGAAARRPAQVGPAGQCAQIGRAQQAARRRGRIDRDRDTGKVGGLDAHRRRRSQETRQDIRPAPGLHEPKRAARGSLRATGILEQQREGWSMRLAGKIAVIVGAGQSPGEGIGNGRATVLRFAQEGAQILAVDRDLDAAEETAALARQEGGECVAFAADVTREATLAAAMAEAVRALGTHRHPAQQCRGQHRRRRQAARRADRGGLRPGLRRSTCAARSWPASTRIPIMRRAARRARSSTSPRSRRSRTPIRSSPTRRPRRR